MAESTIEWLRKAVPYFRRLGFFQESPQSDDELAETMERKLKEEWGDDWEPAADHADFFLLTHDSRRVWWMDMEADVLPGNNVYLQTFREWAAVSRGAFMPEDITEEWKSDRGPIRVAFHHNGKWYNLSPTFYGDFIDIGILRELNEIIKASGIQFEPYDTFDQTCFLVALTADEKRRLRFERGWTFLF